MTKFVLNWTENILEKEENVGNQHFLLFRHVFKVFFLCQDRLNSSWCVKSFKCSFSSLKAKTKLLQKEAVDKEAISRHVSVHQVSIRFGCQKRFVSR